MRRKSIVRLNLIRSVSEYSQRPIARHFNEVWELFLRGHKDDAMAIIDQTDPDNNIRVLAEDIEERGQQEPVEVRHVKDGYEIQRGLCRCFAIAYLGKPSIIVAIE